VVDANYTCGSNMADVPFGFVRIGKLWNRPIPWSVSGED